MKLKFILIGLLFLFGQSLFGQVPDLGSYGFRLVKTVEDINFDYQRLESYFSDKTRLNAPDTDAQAIFEPIKGYYTFYIFLGDLLSEVVDDTLRAYYPAAIDKQQMLVVKAEDSKVITDGFLFPYANRDLPLSESLFRVSTKDFQFKKRFSLEKLNLRNLYNKGLRANTGSVYVPEDVFWPEAAAIEGLELRYNLVKKVDAADFNYKLFDDFEWYNDNVLKERQDILDIIEPVSGNFIYYQFITSYVMSQLVFPDPKEKRDSFDAKLEVFVVPSPNLYPIGVSENVLILKTDAVGVIVDGYEFTLCKRQIPITEDTRRASSEGVRLRDGMFLYEVKLSGGDDVDKHYDRIRKISLFPK